jgi:hypothetical protein
MNWINEIPQESGYYWFIGYPWNNRKEHGNELYFVSVKKISNGFMYITDGNFMENKNGLWQKVILPEIPEGIIIV